MPWSDRDVRQLLSCLRRSRDLEALPMALQLRLCLRTATARDAVLQAIDLTFKQNHGSDPDMAELLRQSYVYGWKAPAIARALNVSLRTFFRFKAEAVAALSVMIEKLLANTNATPLGYRVARTIAPLDSKFAADMLNNEARELGPRVAYEAVLMSLMSGSEVSNDMLARCTGYWGVIARIQIGCAAILAGKPSGLARWRDAAIERAHQLRGVARERCDFEIAYVDRIDALRRSDLPAMAAAADRMQRAAQTQPTLTALALLAQAEQACETGNLDEAERLLGRLEAASDEPSHARLIGRTAHVAGIVHMLRGRFERSLTYSQAASYALAEIDPGYALCAAGNAGRVSLWLGKPWQPPHETLKRFPDFFVSAYVEAVWARQLIDADPKLAADTARRAVLTATRQGATAVSGYARAALSLALAKSGKQQEACREAVAAWRTLVNLGNALMLHGALIHPALAPLDFGAAPPASDLVVAASERLAVLVENAAGVGVSADLLNDLVLEAMSQATDAGWRSSRARDRSRERTIPAALLTRDSQKSEAIVAAIQRLAVELSYCLMPQRRPHFDEQFATAALGALPDTPEGGQVAS